MKVETHEIVAAHLVDQTPEGYFPGRYPRVLVLEFASGELWCTHSSTHEDDCEHVRVVRASRGG